MEREVGGRIGMGNTCKPMAVSFQCMTKSTTNKKKKPHTHKKRGSGGKNKQKKSFPKFCVMTEALWWFIYLLKILGHGVKQAFSTEMLKLAIFTYENQSR